MCITLLHLKDLAEKFLIVNAELIPCYAENTTLLIFFCTGLENAFRAQKTSHFYPNVFEISVW